MRKPSAAERTLSLLEPLSHSSQEPEETTERRTGQRMPPDHTKDLLSMVSQTFTPGRTKHFMLAHKDGASFALKIVEGDLANPSRDWCMALTRDEFDNLVDAVRAVWKEVRSE